jgi:hypothetical protein
VHGKAAKGGKTHAPERVAMYRKEDKEQLRFENFYLPFGGKLDENNRWIRLSKLVLFIWL